MLVHAEPLLDVPLYEIRPRLAEPLSVPVEPPQGGSVDPRWQGGFPRAGHGAQCITTCSAVLQTLLAGAIGRDAHAKPLRGRAASDERPADGAGAASRP